jgi:hypothetical protein
MKFLRLAIAAAAIAAVAVPAAASAAGSVSVGPTAPLLNNITAFIPVSVSCDNPFATFNLFVTLKEAVGKSVASGNTGTTFGGCDGTVHLLSVPVSVAGTTPFKQGAAVVTANASTFFFPPESASAGPQSIQLEKTK